MPNLCTVISLIVMFGVLLSLIWCSLLPPVISATAYCVRPQAVDLCDCSGVTHDCETFDAFPAIYFTSGATFQFMSGYHTLYDTSFIVKELTGLSLIKDAWATDSVIVQVYGSVTEDYWFTILNSWGITISGIEFDMEPHTNAFKFHNVSDVVFQHTTSYFTEYGGRFVYMINGHNITLRDASIVFPDPFSLANDSNITASSPDGRSSGVYISNTAGSVVIDSCIFNGPFYGYSIYIHSSNFNYNCTRTNEIVINNSTFNESTGVHILFEDTSSGCLNISVSKSVFKMAEECDLKLNSTAVEFELVVELNSNIFETSSGFGVVFSLYVFNNVYIHNCTFRDNRNTALVVDVGPNRALFHIENSVFLNNPALAKKQYYSFQAKALVVGNPMGCTENSNQLIIKNVSFIENGLASQGIQGFEKPIVLLCIKTLSLINCSFVNNNGTPIWATSSSLFMTGNIRFIGNTAIEGAGIYFNGESQMVLYKATVNFTNNHALATGGAVQIVDNSLYPPFSIPVCFVSVEEGSESRLIFANNTAKNGGDAIYGGSLYQASMGNTTCFSYVQHISEFIPPYHNGEKNNLSLISSAPLQVCLCERDEGPMCVSYSTVSLYPGETIDVHVFTVGQLCGTVKGTVYAYTNENITIETLQRSQKVTQYNCQSNVLKYTVKSMEDSVKQALFLTAFDISGTDYFNAQDTVEQTSADVCPTSDDESIVPLVLGMYFEECPPGFQLVNGSCICIDQLQQLASKFDVKCTIGREPTIQRDKSLYLCNFTDQEDTFLYSVGCLSTHCNFSKVEVHQHSPDAQCIDNHTGILCGKCHKGFSLAIGSSRCLKYCSNIHILLLIPFAVLGVVLVAVIKCLNLTVSQGSLNGLIFYANIIQTSNSAFLSQTGIGGTMLAVIIAWLNLDFGIETCFAHGLDMYLKTWLQYVFPLYIWTLTLVIIILCRYSQKCTRFFGSNTVQILCTLFLLSYNKLLRTITVAFSLATVIHIQNNIVNTEVVWAYDGDFNHKHIWLLVVSAAVFTFLWLPFTIFLLLGPWLQRFNHYRGLRWVARMTPLLDAFYSPFKAQHRYWVGLLLLARVVVIIPAAIPSATDSSSVLTVALLSICLLFYTSGVRGVYKRKYLSLLEDSFLVNLIAYSALASYSNLGKEIAAYFSFVHVSLALLIIVIVQVYRKMGGKGCNNPTVTACVVNDRDGANIGRDGYSNLDHDDPTTYRE